MFVKSSIVALVVAASLPVTYGRFLMAERDGRAIFPRRFGQEQCGGLPGKIGAACAGNICGVLGGKTISTLLAASPECAQQDLADEIINASKDQDAATAANMVAVRGVTEILFQLLNFPYSSPFNLDNAKRTLLRTSRRSRSFSGWSFDLINDYP